MYWFGCDPTEQSAVPHGLDASQMLVKTQLVQLDDGLYPLLQDNEQTMISKLYLCQNSFPYHNHNH